MRGLLTLALSLCLLSAGMAQAKPGMIELSPWKGRGYVVTYTEATAPPGTYSIGMTWPVALIGFEFGSEMVGTLYACDGVTFVADLCDTIATLSGDLPPFTFRTVRSHYVVVVGTDEGSATSSRLTIRGTHEQVEVDTGGGAVAVDSAHARCLIAAYSKYSCNFGNNGAPGVFTVANSPEEMEACVESAVLGDRRTCYYDSLIHALPTTEGSQWTLAAIPQEIFVVFRKGALCTANFTTGESLPTDRRVLELTTPAGAYGGLIQYSHTGCTYQMLQDGQSLVRADLRWTGINVNRKDDGKVLDSAINRYEFHNIKVLNDGGYGSAVAVGFNGAHCSEFFVTDSDLYSFIPVDAKQDCSGSGITTSVSDSVLEVIQGEQSPDAETSFRAFKVEADTEWRSYRNVYKNSRISFNGGTTGSRHEFYDDIFIQHQKGQVWWLQHSGGDSDQFMYMRGARFIMIQADKTGSSGFFISIGTPLDIDLEGSFETCDGLGDLGSGAFVGANVASTNIFRIDFDFPERCYNNTDFELTRSEFDTNMDTANMNGIVRIGNRFVTYDKGTGVRQPITGGTQSTIVNALGSGFITIDVSATSNGGDLNTGREICATVGRECTSARNKTGATAITDCDTTVTAAVEFEASCDVYMVLNGT